MKNLISIEDHQRVMATGVDVPEEFPTFAIPLTEVGISAKTVWIRVPEGRLPFTAEIHVDLRSDARGIHMSRMEEAISELADEEFSDPRHYGIELGKKILKSQKAGRGGVTLQGQLPWQRLATASKKVSQDTVDVSATISFSWVDNTILSQSMIGAGVSHITVCPCTQAYNRVLFGQAQNDCPMPTHSQRSNTKLMVESDPDRLTYAQVVSCLESALHVTQDLMKRPDEANIVLKAHHYPQFVEDAVRETARAAGLQFGRILPESTRVIIESLSFESIHIHDVQCRLDTTLREILAQL